MIGIAWLQQILNKIGVNTDAASMSTTLFAGQQKIADDIAAISSISSGDVETACGNALGTYDPPTKAEMDTAVTGTKVAQKGVAFTVEFPIYKSDGTLITGAAGLDSEVSKDHGTFADCTNEATEIATNSGYYYLALTATEMNADAVAVVVKTSSTGAILPTITIYTR